LACVQPHCRLAASPRGNPANIRTSLIFLETRVIDLHFAADSLGLSSLKFFWGSVKLFSLQERRFGRPGSYKIIDFGTNRNFESPYTRFPICPS